MTCTQSACRQVTINTLYLYADCDIIRISEMFTLRRMQTLHSSRAKNYPCAENRHVSTNITVALCMNQWILSMAEYDRYIEMPDLKDGSCKPATTFRGNFKFPLRFPHILHKTEIVKFYCMRLCHPAYTVWARDLNQSGVHMRAH